MSTATETITQSAPPQPTATEIPSPTTSAPVPTETLPTSSTESSGASLAVNDIRVGAHERFDRVVIEFGGTGVPGYNVRFTDDPRQDGSGNPVAVQGRSIIQVVIHGVRYAGDTGVTEFHGPNPVPGIGTITGVHWAGVFEGQARIFVGVEADKPAVQVSTLKSPTRLVLDIAH